MLLRHSPLAVCLLALFAPADALAQRQTTREALERFEEVMTGRVEDASLNAKELLPVVVVGVTPAFEESRGWFPTAAVTSLARIFGKTGLRTCEACLAPRTFVEEGRIEESSGAIGLDEVVRLDDQLRGVAAPARTAAWVDEFEDGVSVRLVDLRNGRVVLAENFDTRLKERARTEHGYTLALELDRRAKGNSLTQLFFDAVIYPNQRFALDFLDQWGDTNANLSGVTVSILDPVLGIGGAYYRVFPDALNVMVGGSVLVSIPLGIINSVGVDAGNLLGDNLVTGVLTVRLPFGRSNYGAVLSISTNGRVGLGLSLMNISFLPFIL